MLIRFVTAPIDEDSQVESGIVVAAYRLRDDAHLSAYEHRPLVDCLRWVRRAPAAPGLPAAAETTIARGSRRRALADIQHCLGRVELLPTQHLVDAAYVQSGGRRGLKMAASLPFVCVQRLACSTARASAWHQWSPGSQQCSRFRSPHCGYV
jgi:hypothetical protein